MEESVSAVIDKIGFRKFNWFVVFAFGVLVALEGVEVTVISLLAPFLQCEWDMSPLQTGIVSAAVFVGMGIGSIYWGLLSDTSGRRVTMLISTVYVFYFGMLTAVTTNLFWFVLIRIFVGVGIGGIGCGICYVTEYCTTTYRAKVLIAGQCFFAVGNLIAAFLSYLTMTTLGWRVLVVCCALPMPLATALILWFPESLTYLQNTGNYDAIMKVLHFVTKQNNYSMPSNLIIQCRRSDARGNFNALFNHTYWKTTTVLTILLTVSWWLYYGVMLLNTKILQKDIYAPHNKTSTMIGCQQLEASDYLQNLFVVIGEFPGIIISTFFVDILGRKKVLMFWFSVAGISYGVLAAPLTRKTMTVFIFLIRASAASLAPVLYVITTEVFPTVIRNTAVGFCLVTGRIFLAVLPLTMDILIETSYTGLVATLSALSILSALLCLVLPETTGKQLLST